MASVHLDVAVKRDWLPANPWLWLGTGLGFCVWAWAWTAVVGSLASDNRLFALALGLPLASFGVWLRYRDRATVYVGAAVPPLAFFLRMLLCGFFAAVAVALTGLLIATPFYEQRLGLHAGAVTLVWLGAAPLAVGAALRCLKRKTGQGALEADEEIGVAFGILAVCCLLGRVALLRDPVGDPTDWDSFRLCLRVFALVSLFAGALVLVSMRQRRLTLSLLFTLHFTGICSAALSAPPAPRIVQQIWVRLYRPYLEFMYLNNAYHYFAPEPGPSSYLWFRVIFTDEQGNEQGLWHKVPKLDDSGRSMHPVALEYQRYISLTESIAQTLPLPSEFHFNAVTKQWEPQPIFFNRLQLEPMPNEPIIIGVDKADQLRIPLHPALTKMQQVKIPADMPQRLLQSMARHLAHQYATHEDELGRPLKFKSVKMYRVIHAIPPIQWFQLKMPANDPIWYRPFYLGNYDSEGNLIHDGDPYLYWLVPIIREHPGDPDSMIKDYCRKHAGDPRWYRKPTDPD